MQIMTRGETGQVKKRVYILEWLIKLRGVLFVVLGLQGGNQTGGQHHHGGDDAAGSVGVGGRRLRARGRAGARCRLRGG